MKNKCVFSLVYDKVTELTILYVFLIMDYNFYLLNNQQKILHSHKFYKHITVLCECKSG